MTACEMCGSDSNTITALIEGVELNVCQKCASFGKIVKKPFIVTAKMQQAQKNEQMKKAAEREIIMEIREDFPAIIKAKREKMGLKQDEFAKFISERESMIHKMESGEYVPSLETARKMERQLGIKIIEEKELVASHMKEKKESFTIGDVLKVK
jgi:putative transcription factor